MRFEQAWREYKVAWARSVAGEHASLADIDPDAKRRALRAFRAGWRAAFRNLGEPLGECTHPTIDVMSPSDTRGICSRCGKVVPT